jgi:serine/threonine-protein kinase
MWCPEDPVVGAVIGSYQLVQKLGEGGMGAVYLGHHQLLGRRAAIKVLLPELSARPDIVNRFFNEARAETSISDPGIVQVFDFGYHTDGSAFIVMEYLDGEPLDRRLTRLGRLSVHETMRLARQLAISLAAAHAQHIVHRDLKPENVFLVPDAEVAGGERSKILDFGIAKLSDEHPGKLKTRTGMMMGTPTYMSPEQCRGLADVDHRSDIYSLGCVLFHLLTGRPPFEGEAPGDIMAAHIREPAAPPSSRVPDVPPGVDAVVLRCLAKAPADRFQSMGELTAAVAAVPPQLSVGTAASHPMPAMPAMPMTVRMPAGGTPVPPGPVTPGAGTAPSMPTTLGASAGQFASARTAPGTPVPPAPRERRVGLWIAGGLIVAAAGIGIAIVGTGGGGARMTSRPDPAVVEGAPAAGAGNAPPARSAASAPTPANGPTNGPTEANPPGANPPPSNAPAAVGSPAAAATTPADAPAPAQAASPGAAVTGGTGGPEAGSAGGEPPRSKEPAKAASGHDAGKKPAHRKRPVAEPAPDEPAAAAAAAPAAAPAPKPPAPPPAAKPGGNSCSKAVFAAVYNAPAPTKDAVRAAIRTLNACHTAGAISDTDYDQTQAALVSRF